MKPECLNNNQRQPPGIKKVLFFLMACIFALYSCVSQGDLRKWKKDTTACNYRTVETAMAIIDKYNLIGKDKSEVIKILGKPDGISNTDDDINLFYVLEGKCAGKKYIDAGRLLNVRCTKDEYGWIKMESYSFMY